MKISTSNHRKINKNHNSIPLGNKNEWTTDSKISMDKSQKYYIERNNPITKEYIHIISFMCNSGTGKTNLWEENCNSSYFSNGTEWRVAKGTFLCDEILFQNVCYVCQN